MLIKHIKSHHKNSHRYYHHLVRGIDQAIAKPLAFIIFLFPAFAALANTADEQCLRCHSFEQLSTKLENGEKLSLHVPNGVLKESVHHWADCTTCHRDLDAENHMVSNKKRYASKREHSVALNKICYQCHQDISHQYKGSIHAAMVAAGNPAAPLCTDCHGSHSVKPKATYDTLTGVPCKKCHANIFAAYQESMHGQARGKLGHIQAPICSDCHHAHDINVAATEERLKEACLGCHKEVSNAHGKWLPNAALHLKVISCPACHAPAAQRRVDLMLYDSTAQRPLSQDKLTSQLGSAADPKGGGENGLDPKALWNLVRSMNSGQDSTEVTLKGRVKVATGEQAHRMASKDKALRDCESCHSAEADTFDNVTVSIVRADGKPVSYNAQKEVLNSALSVDSIGEFYALGGTRIRILDILLLLVVIGGSSILIGHLALRKLFKKSK